MNKKFIIIWCIMEGKKAYNLCVEILEDLPLMHFEGRNLVGDDSFYVRPLIEMEGGMEKAKTLTKEELMAISREYEKSLE